jgi:hypothetical protein
VAILAGAAVIMVLLLRDAGGSSPAADYRTKIATVLEPLTPANDALSDDLEALAPGGLPEAALASATVALSDTRAARRELAALRLPPEAVGLRANSTGALRLEAAYLTAVRTVLGEGSSTTVGSKAAAARLAWRRVAREIPGAGGTIAGIDALLAWDRGVPAIPDGDAGPGEAPADLPAAPSVHVCGDATGVNDVVGVGVGCAEAFDIAAKAPLARNAAGVNGYLCSGGATGPQGIEWSCDGPAGERVAFYAVDP